MFIYIYIIKGNIPIRISVVEDYRLNITWPISTKTKKKTVYKDTRKVYRVA